MGAQVERLAGELKLLIREAGRDPEALEARIPLLSSLFPVSSSSVRDEPTAVHVVIHRLVPTYLERLPEGPESNAIRELFKWESEDGSYRPLTSRYVEAARHLHNATEDFGRRQEPRLLRICARRFLALHQEDRLEFAAQAQAGEFVHDEDLSPAAIELWEKEMRIHDERVAAIREGYVTFVTQDEIFDALLALTEVAKQRLCAVDFIKPEEWFTNPRLGEYLDAQLDLARGDEVTVERIRVVEPRHLKDQETRRRLKQLVTLHDDAGAHLWLCPISLVRTMGLVLYPPTGLLLVDPEDQPACLLGFFGEAGFIERATVYLRPLHAVREHDYAYKRLREHVRLPRNDARLRRQLKI